jgi:hypothetical protein
VDGALLSCKQQVPGSSPGASSQNRRSDLFEIPCLAGVGYLSSWLVASAIDYDTSLAAMTCAPIIESSAAALPDRRRCEGEPATALNFAAYGRRRPGKTGFRTAVPRRLLARKKSGVQIPSPPPSNSLVTGLAGRLRRAGSAPPLPAGQQTPNGQRARVERSASASRRNAASGTGGCSPSGTAAGARAPGRPRTVAPDGCARTARRSRGSGGSS